MKTQSFENIILKRNLKFHLMVVLLSAITVFIFSILRPDQFSQGGHLNMFFLLVIQLEVFLFIAGKIFFGFKPAASRKELTKSVLARFALFMILCFITALTINLISIVIRNLAEGKSVYEAITGFFRYSFPGWLKATFGGLLFGAAIFIFMQWQDALKREQKLREENLIFQNETLKNQVNPHFLFNSLNTLSALITVQPDLAEEFISRLSSIYRYILENCPKDRVTLKEELTFISDYFFLHKIRDDGKIGLSINIVDDSDFHILPVSLQILVENGIKHNRATREEPLNISIYIEDQQIVVKNNLQKMATQIKSTGIGLRNLGERVRLVTGKEIIIEETNGYFIVKIPLLK
jgi:hypothetical protein